MAIRTVLLCLVCVLCQSCREQVESYYPALSDAVNDGAVSRGWIPDVLPDSSKSIHEIHNPSSPRTWCAFEFVPDDSRRLEKRATAAAALPAAVKHIDDPGVPWWPDILKGELDAAAIRRDGLALYTLEEPAFGSHTNLVLIAVDSAKGRGFFYRAPDP
jgi:hypothetical protein